MLYMYINISVKYMINLFGVTLWYLYFHLTDINECNMKEGGCSHICNNDPGTYSCSCNPGYELYAYPDFNNISLADGETGTRAGDKIRINHTCVSKWLKFVISKLNCNTSYPLLSWL